MAFDEELAARIRRSLAKRRQVAERKMFGGLGFMLNGNLLVGVWKNSMIVRLGPEGAVDALQEPHVGEFNITGKAMKRWVMIAAPGVAAESQVDSWVRRAEQFVRSLPAK